MIDLGDKIEFTVIKSNLSAVLHFNPVIESGSVNAQVKIPMSLTIGRWTFSEGTFSGNEKFEGIILMNAGIRPDVYGGIRWKIRFLMNPYMTGATVCQFS